jgi:hypothetical protein
MCRYIKDNGEQCGRDTEPFCHQHSDTRFAVLWERTEGDSKSREDGVEPLECEWTPTHCEKCESAVRVVCARLDEAAFQPKKVVPTFALTCKCGNSVQFNLDWDSIPKGEVPSKWLFDSDKEGSWDTENEELVGR